MKIFSAALDSRRSLALGLLVPTLMLCLPAAAQPADDATQAGRFDNGKMWTFEDPPTDYLAEAYGLQPDAAWFEKARLSALRLPNCSASFVSPYGLVATNHHCARSSVTRVTRPGENFLDDGFLTGSLDEERKVDGLYVDQLVAIEDVTAEVDAALEGMETDAERAEARRTAVEQAQQRIAEAAGGEEAGFRVQVVSLYNGGKYSAYTFRRYDDVRLVMAAELQMGYFGGDADNFTYPRYALDVSFLRVYGDDGQPLNTSAHYFPWSQEGVQAGDLVFVIGNPGSTNRLETVAQLEWRRDVQVEAALQFINSRVDALRAYQDENPGDEEARNTLFSLLNGQKAYLGRQDALRDPVILARRRDAERQFREAVARDADLSSRYGDLIDRMAAVQRQKLESGADYGAFYALENRRFSSATLRRALLAERLLRRQAAGASEDVADLKTALRAVTDQPPGLDRRFLAAQFEDFQRFLGGTDLLPAVLQGRSPEDAAAALYDGTMLRDAASTAEALDAGALRLADPAVAVAKAIAPRYETFGSAVAGLNAQERELGSRLGRARFDVYGTAVPPDATFSLRFTDGIVKGYEYNGTLAPPFTTFYGLYDHYYSYGADSEWDLPARWHHPPPTFDKTTPMNFVSTSDTIGGNSGSPAVNRDLELVGLNFDRTIEGLSRDYIYLPDRGRNVMVDARAILEALDEIYDMDRLALELTTGRLVQTEAEADAAGSQ